MSRLVYDLSAQSFFPIDASFPIDVSFLEGVFFLEVPFVGEVFLGMVFFSASVYGSLESKLT